MNKPKLTTSKTISSNERSPKECGFCMYLGPTIVGVIQHGTIFPGSRDQFAESLKDAITRYPLIKTLIVGSDTLPEDRIRARTPGNLLYVNYHKLAKGDK